MDARWRGLLVVALLLAGFALKSLVLVPPAAEWSEFDTARAAERLQRILSDERPHPVDSPAGDAVRTRLLTELRTVGLSPEIHEATDCSAMPNTRIVSCSHVRNVIARVPSRRPGRQLLLNAHYDSTPAGPGAADDGLGVAVLLEVGAVLKSSPPPRPVTLLFNEGEEFGLNGAHAFVRADPVSRAVDSLINIDVRGVSGPALMYETSDPNEAAISLYANATRRPYANSISTDFAKLIPNTTDVVFFKPLGWTLLNYGIIGNETRYHSPGDTVEKVDRDSLGHVGGEVLAAVRAMTAASRPSATETGRTVFTDLGGRMLVRLPLVFAAALLTVLLLAAMLLCWRRRAIGRPFLAVLAVTLGGMAAAGFASFLLTLSRPGDFWRAYPLVAYLALYAILLMSMAMLQIRIARGLEIRRMRAAAWLVVLLLGSAFSLALPGATIFFLISPAIGLAAVASSTRAPHVAAALGVAAAVIQFVMLSELLALVEMLLVDGPLAAVVPLAAIAALPALVEIDARALRPAIIFLGICSTGLTAAALAMPRSSAERPLGFSIDYFRDVPNRNASWAIASKQAPLPGNYPGKWERGVLPYNGRPRWIMPAAFLATPEASARVLSDKPTNKGRRLRLMLFAGGANTVTIRLPRNAKLVAIGLPGAMIPIASRGEPEKPLLRCSGRSCHGLEIEMLLGERGPLQAELFATTFGLPPEGRPLVAGRPRNAIPQYAPDQTITRTVVRL